MNLLRRLGLWLAIYALDLQIKGATDCMKCVSDPLLLGRMDIARSMARRERARLRSEYNATFPPGQRRTWNLA